MVIPIIDMVKTGQNINRLRKDAGIGSCVCLCMMRRKDA